MKVNYEFYDIGIFGIHLATKNRWYFREKNFQNSKNKEKKIKEYMFYFTVIDREVNFALMDYHLNPIYFSSRQIEELKKNYPAEYKLFIQFEKKMIKDDQANDDVK